MGHVQPGSAAQVDAVAFVPHPRGVPEHAPALGVLSLQPGTVVHVEFDSDAHDVVRGTPAQCGPTENVSVASGNRVRADLQQICPEQSLLAPHVLGQVLLHMPPQQISPAAVLQSADWAQATGQDA